MQCYILIRTVKKSWYTQKNFNEMILDTQKGNFPIKSTIQNVSEAVEEST